MSKRISALLVSVCLIASSVVYPYAEEKKMEEPLVEMQDSFSNVEDVFCNDDVIEDVDDGFEDYSSDCDSYMNEEGEHNSEAINMDESTLSEDVQVTDLNNKKLDDSTINSAQYTPDYGIPRLNLELSGTSIEEVNGGTKDIEYKKNVLSIYDSLDLSQNAVYDKVELKGRGNYTWTLSKKPYQIKFDKKVSLFNMEPSKKYVLLANAADTTLLRNVFGFALGAQMGLWHSNYQFIDLYADGQYLGNYLLTQKTEAAPYSVDLKNEDGILVELDLREADDDDYALFSTYSGCHLVLKDSVDDDDEEICKQAMQSFTDDFSTVEEAAHEGDWSTVESLLDVQSFALYYLFQELIANPDAARTSFFMYRDGTHDKIHAGPVWDFDVAMGNSVYNWNDTGKMWLMLDERDLTANYPETGIQTTLFNDLMKINEFRELAASIWNQNGHELCDNSLTVISDQASYAKRSMAADAAKWGYTTVNSSVISDFISKRADYFDVFFSDSVQLESGEEYDLAIGSYNVSYVSTQVGETFFMSGHKVGRQHGFCFRFDEESQYYLLTDLSGEFALTADENDQTKVYFSENNNGADQKWIVHKNSDDSKTIVSALTGYVLSIENDSINDGMSVVLKTYNGSSTQKFLIRKPEESHMGIKKLTGQSRYETAVMSAVEAFPLGAESIVLASGQNFPDALAAGSLAGVLKASILLTAQNTLSEPVRNLLQGKWSGKVREVYIIGGLISNQVVDSLKECGIESSHIHRYYGDSRYSTAEAVFRQTSARSRNIDTVAIASGSTPADALSFSPWSYSKQIPILLANSSGELSAASKSIVSRYQVKNIILLGGGVKESCACGKDYIRLAGNTRYETSIRIAEHFAENTNMYEGTVFAKGGDRDFPDALVAGPLAGKNNSPVVLLSGTNDLSYQLLQDNASALRSGCYMIGSAGSDNAIVSRVNNALS